MGCFVLAVTIASCMPRTFFLPSPPLAGLLRHLVWGGEVRLGNDDTGLAALGLSSS